MLLSDRQMLGYSRHLTPGSSTTRTGVKDAGC